MVFLIIREATAKELNLIQSYANVVQEEATVGYLNEQNVIGENLNTAGNKTYFVCENNDEVYGWILLGEVIGPYKKEISGMVLEVYVLPTHRKKGIGEKLMYFAIDYFKQRSVTNLQLNVFAGNPAIQLYEKLGFREVSRLMEKPLNKVQEYKYNQAIL